MKKSILFLGAIALLASCTKKDVAVSNASAKNSTMDATAASYDYTQPMSTILKDATVNSTGRAQQIIGGANSTNVVYVKPGIWVGDINIGGTLNTLCWPTGGICEIIVVASRITKATNSQIFSGSAQAPVAGIKALPTGPVGYTATEVVITDNADEEGHISVNRQLID